MEINPLVVTGQNELLAVDAKVNLDDNALFRHAELAAMFDPAQEDETEVVCAAAWLKLYFARWRSRLHG